MGNEEVLLGGHWNLIMDQEYDCKNYVRMNNRNAREVVLAYMDRLDLVDIWRKMHPSIRRYTWRISNFKKQARLDFYLCTQGLGHSISKSDIELGYRTDHSSIIVNIRKGEKRGNGFWKFNASLLRESEYAGLVKKTIRKTAEIFAASPYNREALYQM